MTLALCPVCRVLHQIVRPTALVDVDEERAYSITHCRHCECSSGQFLPLKDADDTAPNDIGYPAAVVPLFEGQYRDWWLVGPEKLALLAKASLRVRLVRYLADEMRVPAERVAEWAGLSVTAAMKPVPGKTLELDQGLRLLWMARLIGQAEEMVDRAGKSAGFNAPAWMGAWLQAAHPALGGVSPGDYLLRSDGPQIVSELLARLESGAYS
ncbi:antitoxin Xre/MbcA/ParS toxin-binding domain-containing protein [Paucibacter sp. B51]|uniref:antitoxin Xre/MbcA/ParS toxin-binding domain-containing protein n=1 Tax=Paucibacter sp. B51 TaxID=2993315 RepID=UPI0022EC01E3|nr:antitoxin Xre/MbcA/ParS toxin-binding domain-containing protein [Paucibacter sp. B51]